jgi:hypothetical protein
LQGKTFTPYKLAAHASSYFSSGAVDAYGQLCEAVGLWPMVTGHSNGCDSYCAGQ